MEITCRQCQSKFRAALHLPLTQAVRLICPSCGKSMVLKPNTGEGSGVPAATVVAAPPVAQPSRKNQAVIADEPREFRNFLVTELQAHGFEVSTFENGEEALRNVRGSRAELVILNVYLKGKLGVEISEEIKADPTLANTKVVLIGALFRANRFRANPTNLYGADEYIEEQIPEKEFHRLISKLFPDVTKAVAPPVESKEFDEARRLARLILSDIIIYNAEKVDEGIRDDNFFELLKDEIKEGRDYYETRISFKVRQTTEFFNETLHHFVQMKREELDRLRSGRNS